MSHRTHLHRSTTHEHDDAGPAAGEGGGLIRWPRRYDLLAEAAYGGRGRRVRREIAAAAGARPGRDLLDVGCGTGTLAVALAAAVAPGGTVSAVDASPEMVAAAARRAARSGSAVLVQQAPAQALPFADGSFDAVTTSLVLHHLPPADRPRAIAEMLRVLRPGGRLVVAEFQAPPGRTAAALTRHVLGPDMAESDLTAVVDLVVGGGAVDAQVLPSPMGWLGLVAGRRAG